MGTKLFGRTLARSQALQLLFQAEARKLSVEQLLEMGCELVDPGPLDEYGLELARGTDSHRQEFDRIIEAYSHDWSLERLNACDRNLLRLALFEMRYMDVVDVSITIDECVELAKAYGTDESSRYINGLLGAVLRNAEFNDAADDEAEE